MKQTKRFMNPVYETGGNNIVVTVGSSVNFRLKDGSYQAETLTAVSNGGKTLSWDHTVNSTREEDVRAVHADHAKDCTQYGGSQPTPDTRGIVGKDDDADSFIDEPGDGS